jgi:hypothetical protein
MSNAIEAKFHSESSSALSEEKQLPQTRSAKPELVSRLDSWQSSRRKARPEEAPVDSEATKYWDESQHAIVLLEKSLNCRVLVFYVAMSSSFTQEDVNEVFHHLADIGFQDELALLLYGPGGSPIAAYRLVKLVRQFCRRLKIIVPDSAASALTMTALGADELITGPLSALSPIDTSIANHPLAPQDKAGEPVTVEINQIQKYLELVHSSSYENGQDFSKTPFVSLSEKIHPVFLGTIQRSLSLSRMLTRGILATHMQDEEAIERIVSKLNDEYPTHSYPILPEDLHQLGLNVSLMQQEHYDICMDLFGYYEVMTQPSEQIHGDVRERWKSLSFIESVDFRSYYYSERREKLVNNNWTTIDSSGWYTRRVVVKNKKGIYEVVVLRSTDVRKWLSGKEIDTAA